MTPVSDPQLCFLNSLIGKNGYIKPLTDGLSESDVYFIDDGTKKSIVKFQSEQVEYDFFTCYTPDNLPNVTWLPKLVDSGKLGTENWLQFEYIPYSWPESNWNRDVNALKILTRIHELPISNSDIKLFDNAWHCSDVLSLESDLSSDLIAMMYKFQPICEKLHDEKQVMCTGDAYPLNWRLRENGELVKIDWQLFSFQNKAADIASWLSTYPDFELAKSVAKKYLLVKEANCSYTDVSNDDVEELAIEIMAFYGRRMGLLYRFSNASSRPQKWNAFINQLEQPLLDWMQKHSSILSRLNKV
ncbi:hypothetical protein MHN79_05285 [Vibrio sp. Of14-4]|uniref:hypothetical protein n=1 Tax=Vibrio sp. Of14-4 TaxID=2724878 RepID=UPI001EF2CD0D|nr:hypothetical protein [Vibrio sp. Of14-4]MCG7488894.1 hypothetical protein [Vibrio sp. Of14-4]